MGRVINTEGAGKERTKLCKTIVLALRELMRQTEMDDKSHDLAAYIALSLLAVDATVEESVVAWEKKGYWVKADRFRMEWEWSGRLGENLRKAILQDDWATVAMVSAQVGQKLMKIEIPVRHKFGSPWDGARLRINAK